MRATLTVSSALALCVLAGCQTGDEAEERPEMGAPDALPDALPDAMPDLAPACEDGAVEPCEVIAGCGGERVCTAGTFGDCRAPVERCDGADNDCDGQTDEGYPDVGEPCSTGVGACAADGVMVCDATGEGTRCHAVAGAPAAEQCNGVDDDCDGAADEEIETGRPCETGEAGVCAAGTTACEGGAPRCVPDVAPSVEQCDGLDNDCDGEVDEVDGLGDACTVGAGACAANGARICDPDAGEVVCDAVAGEPAAELCDGIDNDCDGEVDDVDGVGDDCTVGVGVCAVDGARVCDLDAGEVVCDAVAGEPAVELCDGIDNDCDGEVDDVDGLGDVCTVGVGACAVDGARVCDLDAGALVCDAVAGEPSAELCDGIDNDCDGTPDDVAGLGDACVFDAGACSTDGVMVCDVDRRALTCDAPPPRELCDDGVDNTCDGLVDCDDAQCADLIVCTCGDGVLQGAEACDDGGLDDGDGCSHMCRVEAGWGCRPPAVEQCPPGVDGDTTLLVHGAPLPAVGGLGGTAFADACRPGEVIVGLDFAIGPGSAMFPENVAVTRSRARCAELTVTDVVELTPMRVTPTRGNQHALDHELHCPAQHVVVGYLGWAEPPGAQAYPSGVQLLCAPISLDGGEVVIGPAVLTEAIGRRDTFIGRFECAGGEVVVAHSGRAGQLVDRFTLRCARVADGCPTPSHCARPTDCFYAFDEAPLPAVFRPFGAIGWLLDPIGGGAGRGGAAMSGDVDDDQSSAMRLVGVYFPDGGRISFRHRVSSRLGDYFRYLDGQEYLRAWGEQGWEAFERHVTPGVHTFEFVYYKDRGFSGGTDNVWIDDLLLEGAAALCN